MPQITRTTLFSGTKITAYAVESYTWSAPSPADVDPEGDLSDAELDAALARHVRPTTLAEDAWTLQSRWTSEDEALAEARALIAHDAESTRAACGDDSMEILKDGLEYVWRVGDSIAREVTVRVRPVTVRVPA